MKRVSLLLLFVLIGQCLLCQTKKIDSLKIILSTVADDTNKVVALNDLSWEYCSIGDYEKALESATDAKTLSEKINFKRGIGFSYSNMGNIFHAQANYPKALDYHLKSLKIMEAIGNKRGMGISYNNIGNVYADQGNKDKVLEYYLKDLKICEETNDKEGIAITYANMGILYQEKKDYKTSIEYHLKSKKMMEEIGKLEGIAMAYLNLGDNFEDLGQYDSSLIYSFNALAKFKELNSKSDISIVYVNLGSTYNFLKDYKMAAYYSNMGVTLSKEIDEPDNLRLCYENLSLAYAGMKRYDEAYQYHVKFKAITDSIFNEANTSKINEVALNYKLEKKEEEMNAKSALEKERLKTLAEEESKRHFIILSSVIGFLIIVVVFSFFLYKRFKITDRQKQIIESQKYLVMEKQKEIIDSITYAKRIQQAIMPSKEIINRHFPDSFVFYKPKDIVAGDFFWFATSGDMLFLAAADCTGHGVPGAMVSVVCSGALNRAVNEFKLNDTGQILNKTRELVIDAFEISGENVYDGMDISLASIKKINENLFELNWSGANNLLWYFSNGEFLQVKGNKQPIGKSDHFNEFVTTKIRLNKGDYFYLFTDGFQDQFGGPKGKKFKRLQLKELFKTIVSRPSNDQLTMVSTAFENWKLNYEQSDDVTVIGIRV